MQSEGAWRQLCVIVNVVMFLNKLLPVVSEKNMAEQLAEKYIGNLPEFTVDNVAICFQQYMSFHDTKNCRILATTSTKRK